MKSTLTAIPASYFGMVLGLAGLGSGWRTASNLWHFSTLPGELIMGAAGAVWLSLMAAYAAKWLFARSQALAEFRHPIQCCFIGLVPVSAMLIALAAAPYAAKAASMLFIAGAVAQFLFAIHRTGTLWMGGREETGTTPAAYLPTVSGNFVTAIGAASLGFSTLAPLFFGAGVFSWLALESVVLRRLMEAPTMPAPLRPTLGIHFAPAAVACLAYLSITGGEPDLFAQALFGYGLFQGLVLVRLLPWIEAQTFNASYWAVTFGITALAGSALKFMQKGLAGPFEILAPAVLVIANVIVGAIALGTLWLLIRGRLVVRPLAINPA